MKTAWVDGALGGAISPFDPGFLHGDSVFETMRAAATRVVEQGAHLDRLARAARAIEIDLPDRARIEAAIAETLAAAGEAHARVRAIVTRASLVVTVEPCAPLAADPAPIAIAVVDVPLSDPRTLDPSIKTGSYLPNLRAQRAARATGADEGVRLTIDGAVATGATSNLFAVIGGTLVTPPLALGIRDGVTRARVVAVTDARELRFGPDELAAADEVFVTSSIRGVAPAGRTGPRTREIAHAYLAFATRGAG